MKDPFLCQFLPSFLVLYKPWAAERRLLLGGRGFDFLSEESV